MADTPILAVEDLHVSFGHARILQGVNIRLASGVLSVVGRNGMGKTTLCQTLMGLVSAASGSVRLSGTNIMNAAPHKIAARGIGYVPQGRRLWPSLTVEDHLQLAAGLRSGPWTTESVYEIFPRLAERRNNGGANLSGGEQQMLAIGRALLTQPSLLVMDEPTEGLAPVIVDHVIETLKTLVANGMAILLIEQNIRVACDCAQEVAVMVNGKIQTTVASEKLYRDKALQGELLGLGSA
ncbi:ABC transporter ATP-binding protein [Labrenzia sp. 011]|uniref:ABC transporter ATP-binding protein n=1 Tax=Labrenzia sp. 011 TaxID=2171494 RepID=UPI0014028975|nr:ABC transporter ATP-binding protein [Labrenzia sp. 011]